MIKLNVMKEDDSNIELPYNHDISDDAPDYDCDTFTGEEFDKWMKELIDNG